MNLKNQFILPMLVSIVGLLWGTLVYASEEEKILQGEYIFRATGGCGCHTDYENDGDFLAGGRAIQTPFGTFFGTNITPHQETGIGGWSDDDFIRAMTRGIGPDGTNYAPVFPYTSFTQMTKDDLLALKAYLSTVPAIRQENKPHELFIPIGERLGFFVWKKLFFQESPFQYQSDQSAQWNRGAYLAGALAHCEECHTPRNLQGVLDREMRYAGSSDGPEGEFAPNITPDDETGIGEWVIADIVYFLRNGMNPDGDDTQGLMYEVIEHGYTYLSVEDLEALAVYLKALPPLTTPWREGKRNK